MMTGIVATANSVETANTHRHEVFSAMNPEIAGAIIGPYSTVNVYQSILPGEGNPPKVVATMNQAMQSPRWRGSL